MRTPQWVKKLGGDAGDNEPPQYWIATKREVGEACAGHGLTEPATGRGASHLMICHRAGETVGRCSMNIDQGRVDASFQPYPLVIQGAVT
jgi:hypothetical protein